jgi:hypothetical protein
VALDFSMWIWFVHKTKKKNYNYHASHCTHKDQTVLIKHSLCLVACFFFIRSQCHKASECFELLWVVLAVPQSLARFDAVVTHMIMIMMKMIDSTEQV